MDTHRRTYRKICQHCGKEFVALTAFTNYCSTRCASLAEKLRKRNERLATTSIEVRERHRLALLDKNFLTLSDAARLMQMSRNTLYKIIKLYGIEPIRFTDRTIRISREDLEKAVTGIPQTSTAEKDDILSNWMTKEQIMEEYAVTLSWFNSTIKRHRIQPKTIGCKNFYDKDQMDAIFTKNDFSDNQQWCHGIDEDWGDARLTHLYNKAIGFLPALGSLMFIELWWLDPETGFVGETMRVKTVVITDTKAQEEGLEDWMQYTLNNVTEESHVSKLDIDFTTSAPVITHDSVLLGHSNVASSEVYLEDVIPSDMVGMFWTLGRGDAVDKWTMQSYQGQIISYGGKSRIVYMHRGGYYVKPTAVFGTGVFYKQ